MKRRKLSNHEANSTRGLDPPSAVGPLRRYISRARKTKLRTSDLPKKAFEKGIYTPVGLFISVIRSTVPIAYLYILVVLLRETYLNVGAIQDAVDLHVPSAGLIARGMHVSRGMEVWACLEGLFYVLSRLKIKYLQCKDALEACLHCAPIMELHERRLVWNRMIDCESKDVVEFVTGWFFNEKLENISKYDIRDFTAWCMFEGRNQEHLASQELTQLDAFVSELEERINVQLNWRNSEQEVDGKVLRDSTTTFQFSETMDETPPTFFMNIYENYKLKYEEYREKFENTDFPSMQNVRNFMLEKTQEMNEARERTMETASKMYDKAYFSIIDEGSNMEKYIATLSYATQTFLTPNVDKRISALSHAKHATHAQLTEIWKHMCEIPLETAEFIVRRKTLLSQQMKGYQLMLERTRSMSSSVPSPQIVDLLHNITRCNDAIERIEFFAKDAFMKTTGFVTNNTIARREPQRYLNYSRDPLLGIITYPLGFHLFVLSFTDGGLWILMKMRGFKRVTKGHISYYFHPGMEFNPNNSSKPICFVHGIGLGNIVYLSLIDKLLTLGRPLFLPEIPYVTAFKSWQRSKSILSQGAVVSALTTMLANEGFLSATFVGHSYGTSWLSYMCKIAPSVVDRLIFIDPICFCLHRHFLTESFVYKQGDPGCTGYLVITDVIVNWTIQRCFPWARIALFVEDIKKPTTVFLSGADLTVPTQCVLRYLLKKGAVVGAGAIDDRLRVEVFPDEEHGGWVGKSVLMDKIVSAVER